jgi:7-carboxy-7-deazaguanine synthase
MERKEPCELYHLWRQYLVNREWYQVNEIFHAPQGEGIHVGTMATFIRLQGCTVGCSWCDTKYTWHKGGEKMGLGQIRFAAHNRHVVVTGGEPTAWDLDGLFAALRADGHFVQLETSGQHGLHDIRPNWVTCSPKENLGFKIHPDLGSVDELKFVVDDTFNIDVARALVKENTPMAAVLQPEGNPPTQEHIAKTLALVSLYPEFRFGCRLHTWIGTR